MGQEILWNVLNNLYLFSNMILFLILTFLSPSHTGLLVSSLSFLIVSIVIVTYRIFNVLNTVINVDSVSTIKFLPLHVPLSLPRPPSLPDYHCPSFGTQVKYHVLCRSSLIPLDTGVTSSFMCCFSTGPLSR